MVSMCKDALVVSSVHTGWVRGALRSQWPLKTTMVPFYSQAKNIQAICFLRVLRCGVKVSRMFNQMGVYPRLLIISIGYGVYILCLEKCTFISQTIFIF